jgi:hypothetical protein
MLHYARLVLAVSVKEGKGSGRLGLVKATHVLIVDFENYESKQSHLFVLMAKLCLLPLHNFRNIEAKLAKASFRERSQLKMTSGFWVTYLNKNFFLPLSYVPSSSLSSRQ